MLINEVLGITKTDVSSFAQGAVNRLAQRAGTAGIPQPSNAPKFAINAQGQAAQVSAPLVNQMAQSLNVGWSEALQQAMAQTHNRATGKRGVNSVKDIPRDELERALTSQLNATLGKLSNGSIRDYHQISSMVDPTAYNGQGRQVADRAVRELETAVGTILATEPSTANQTKLSRLWQTTAEKLYTVSSLAQFQAQQVTTQFGQTANGQLTVNGRPVQDASGKDIMIGTPAAAQYMQQFTSGSEPTTSTGVPPSVPPQRGALRGQVGAQPRRTR